MGTQEHNVAHSDNASHQHASVALAESMIDSMRTLLKDPLYPAIYRLWERAGFHVTRNHFYSPIPDLGELPAEHWMRESSLLGIDMQERKQLGLLIDVFPQYRAEYEALALERSGASNGFHLHNPMFSGTDALVAYCLVRHLQPKRIIEVGSGYSSLLMAEAGTKNGGTSLTCIEPYPREFLRTGFPGLEKLIESPVQDVSTTLFETLSANDILFIDSSHVVRIGGDVNYLFFEVLPRLRPGVYVHIHDIFLPLDYRREWVVDELRFWTEQYLLQAFLMFNSEFEVVFANSYMARRHMDEFRKTFPTSPWWGGGSFWIRRVEA
jgi:hypothetical protein